MIKKRVKNFTAMVLMISMIVTNSLTQLLYAAGEDPIQTLQVRDTNQTTTPSVLDLNVSDEWDQFEGDWNITTDGVYTVGSNVNGKSGSKVVAKDKDYSNFTYEADVKLTSGINEDNAGLLFRVTDPTNGADNLKGYYAGIRVDGKVQIGRFNNEWAEIGLGDYPIKTHMTYRLKVVADGNKIDVYVDGNYAASATDDMFSHGSIGMRNWWAATTYSNVSVVDTVEGTDTTEVDKWTFYPVTDTVTENDWMISEHSYKAKSAMGTKIVAKDSDYANFSLQADVSLVGKDGGRNAGFIFRTSDPGVGTDNLKGYYAGIGNGKVQIGKLDNTPGGTAWTELKGVNYPIVDGVTYHLKVVAKDEKIDVYVDGKLATSATDETYESGLIGLRSFLANSQYSNLKIQAADVPVDVSTYEWAQYQGNWAIADGIFNVNAGTGYKVVARDVNISNFAYEADVSISGGTDTGRNAGFIFRVTEPTVGADMLKGYYAGITKNGRVQVGRFNNNWTELAAIPYPIVEGTEYKLKVIASGSNINVYVDGTHVISVTDDMFKSGSIGMRTWLTNATYKNVALTDLGEVIEAEYDWSWVKGAVFVPTNVVNEIQQWKEYDHDINDRELSYAHDYGFNLVRVYLHNLLWEYEKEELLGNFEDFLQLADKYDIKVEVVFFDDCWDDFPKYDYDESIAPRYGAHNSRWVEAPGDTYKAQYNNADGLMKAKMKEYVEGIVGAHLNDDRVAFWNTYNEPSNGESGINDQVTKQLMNDSRIWIKEMGSEIPVSATGGQFSGGPFSDFITWHPYEANYPTNIGGTRPATANKSTLADECMQRQNQTVPGIVQNYYDKGIGFVLWELGIGRDNCRFPWGSDTNPLDYEPAEPFHGVVYPDGHPWSVDDVVAVRGNLDNLAVFNVQYFNDTQFTDLKKTSITPRIDFDLGDERGTGSPDASAQIGEDNFSVRWTGTIKSAAAGNYTIYADSDNIAKVWIGDTQVVNKSTNIREEVSETISLEANKEYSIRVEYVHATGNASMHLKWAVPSGTKTVLLPIYKTKSVTGVSLPETLSVNVEEGKKLIATLEPADTLNQQVTWESSEPGIACVDKDGVVTGIVEGTATITVTTVDGDFKDTCTVTVSPSTEFKNPIVPVSSSAGSADPSVVFKDGYYYYCKSDKDASLVVAKAKRLQDIGSVPRVTVYTPPAGTAYSKEIWAPELQYINGKWYIYFAADDGNNANHRMYAIESDTQDPQGTYTFKGKVADSTNKWAIDGTVLQTDDNKLYFVWSGWEGDTNVKQDLYIAPMSNPWTISGNRVRISTPTETWELNGTPNINEGPEILKKDGKVFIVYSASGSWGDDYCLGMLTNIDGNVLNAASWTKTGPVFSKTAGAYGPGHNCFTVSPDGTEDWIVYHADKNAGGSWANRSVRAQKFIWNADGTPNFGTPAAYEGFITQPSGTPQMNRYKFEAEGAALSGDAKVISRDNASGGKTVDSLTKAGTDSIVFNSYVKEAGNYVLTVMYGNGSEADLAQQDVVVNGAAAQTIHYKKYGSGNINPSSIDVTLNEGSNTIKLEPKTNMSEIDYIVLDRIVQDQVDTPVQAIILDNQTLKVGKGKTVQLIASVKPIGGTNKNVIFTSTNENVLAVSKDSSNTIDGTTTLNVKGLIPGTATIRVASATDQTKYAECSVAVLGDPTEPDFTGFSVDQFDGIALSDTWSIVKENKPNWSLTKNPGFMTIGTTATDIYQNNNSQDNVFLKTLDGNKDFEIVTKLTAPIARNHEQAGLFVWQDADNLIKLAHVWVNGRTLETAYEIGQVYKDPGNFATHPGQDTVTLKIKKIGNIYTTYYWNGYEWIQASNPMTANLQNIKVGFFANSIVSNISMDAKFDYFAYKEIQGGITLDQSKLTLAVGATSEIKNIGPSQDVVWSSSNNKIASVDENGLVTAKAAGRAVIKATSSDGAYSDQAVVTVTSLGTQPETLYEETFDNDASGFTTYGGTWHVSDGRYHVNSGAGYKALVTDELFTDYVLEADVKIESGNEAGLIFRVLNPSEGADAFSGYYIGISAANKSATLGQMNNGVWREIAGKKLPINIGESYHLKVLVNEGHIMIFINDNPLNVKDYPKFDFLEETHLSTGQIGFRTFNAAASFDNLKISSYDEVVLEESYTNAVMPGIADPHVFYYEGVYYLYGTHTADWPNMTRGIKVYTSTDLVHWTMKEEDDGWALKNEDSWGDKQFWAPEVIEKDGTFYMYYAVEEHLAVATSDSPLGPFKQEVQKPIHNDPKEIDAHIFTDDDGKQYMYFVRFTDGNALWGAELNEDMMSIKEETITPVFSVSQDWEKSPKAPTARVNEGPFVIKHKGLYYMTYSGNHFESPDYGVGYATSTSPLGPWTKYEYNPIMKSNSLVPGAGHHSLIYSPDKTELFMIYHTHNAVGTTEPRKLAIDRVQFVPQANGIDSMEVWGPTMTPQPMPSSENTTPNVPVSSLNVTGKDGASTITTKGSALQMVATVTPENATNKEVIWSIESGSSYARISTEGLLTAVKNGIVTVKAVSVSNPAVSNNCEVVITGNEEESTDVAVSSLVVAGKDGISKITIRGGTLQMVVSVLPNNATNKEVTWSIVNGSSYADLSTEGLLKAVRNGTVTVKVISVSNPEISSTCSIVITGNPSRDNDDDDDDNSTSIPTVPNVTHPSTPDVPRAETVRVSISLTNGTASSAGTSIELTVKPYIEKGRTMAGLRDVANLLGIENRSVVWNGSDKTIIITMNNRTIQLAVNQNYVIVNGEKMSLDVAPQVRNGRTVLPIAQIARILGMDVQFDIDTKEVILGTIE